eukprot:s1138_g10.t3
MNRLDLRCATASRKGESVILCHGPDFCGATRCSLHRRSACGGAKYSCGTQGCQRTQQQSARWTRSALGRALRLAFDQWCQCLRTEAPQPMGGAASGERISAVRLQPTLISFNASISCCEKASRWQFARSLLQNAGLVRLAPNVITYSAAISACEKAAEWQQALMLFEELCLESLQPNVVTLGALVSSCESASAWRQGLRIFKNLQACLVQPNAIVYNASISACAKADRPEALILLAELENNGASNVVSYSAAMGACGWQQAIDLLRRMDERRIMGNLILYSAAISACARQGRWRESLALMTEALAHHLQLDMVTEAATISACKMHGEWPRALRLVDGMRLNAFPAYVIAVNSAISCCDQVSEWQQALQLVDGVEEAAQPQMITYNSAISSCQKAMLWPPVLQLLSSALTALLQPTVVTFNACMSACRGRRGDQLAQWPVAMQLAIGMVQWSFKPSLVSLDALTCAEADSWQWQKAMQVFPESRAAGSSSLYPRVASCSALISACEKARQWREVFVIMASAARLRVQPDFVMYNSGHVPVPQSLGNAETFGETEARSSTVTEDDPDALAKEAAKLREEVAVLEQEQEEARRKERQALFRILDTDSSGALDAKELQKGIKDVMGSDVDDATAERLVQALDLNGDGIIQPEELDFDAVQRLLKEFRKEMQSKEEAEKTAAYETTEEQMLRKEWEQFLASRPPRNEDTGLLTRVGSLAAYLLPLTDALRFGMFLFAAFPFIQPFLDLLVIPVLLINALPFGLGYLATFFVMQGLATNKELPALLRYNLRQAITLDIFLVLMSLSGGVFQALANLAQTPIPLEIVGFSSTVIYLVVTACCLYSIAVSLTGNLPTGLGVLSEVAEFQIFDTAPSDGKEDTSKFYDRLFKDKDEKK